MKKLLTCSLLCLLTAAILFGVYVCFARKDQSIPAYQNLTEDAILVDSNAETSSFFSSPLAFLEYAPDVPTAESTAAASIEESITKDTTEELETEDFMEVSIEKSTLKETHMTAYTQEETTTPPATETQASEQPAQQTISNFKVVTYYPFWRYNQIDKVQFSIVTHAIYAFALPNSDATLKPLDNSKSAEQLIAAAHQSGKKVLLGVGGWSDNGALLEPTFKEATSTDEKIRRFADAIVTMCNEYGFDGVDIDWEYPRMEDGSWQQYEKLMVLLGEKLHSQNKLLTAAVICGINPSGSISYTASAQTDTVLNTVDWINIMAYEGDEGAGHSPYDTAVASIAYWHNTRNLPANKIVLGVPFYAKPSGISYENIIKANPEASQNDTAIINGSKIWYNGIPTIQKKTRYAKEHIGGIMVWEITQDTSDRAASLLTAIGEALK